MTNRTIWLAVAGIVLAAACAGCQDHLRQKYETVYLGQPAEDVLRTLGSPTVKKPGEWQWIQRMPFQKAVVTFEAGFVTAKAWFDQKQTPEYDK